MMLRLHILFHEDTLTVYPATTIDFYSPILISQQLVKLELSFLPQLSYRFPISVELIQKIINWGTD